MAKLTNPIAQFGSWVLDVTPALGRITIYMFTSFMWFLRPPLRPKLFFNEMVFMGNKSLFIVALTASFSGMVFAFQIYSGFTAFSVDSFVGPIVAIAVTKELAPVFCGLVVAGRCGAAMAAQIGSMKVTEQVDALEVMGVNAIQYLAVPKIFATVVTMPMLAAIYMLIANVGSYVIGTAVLGVDEALYFAKVPEFMKLSMILEGLIKAAVFGYLIAIVGTYQGFAVKGGAEGVGKGTNMAVVWGMILVLVVDFFLTAILMKVL
ncbi:MAG: ABC transporter permease [Halobacteriovoraceae bacterium]|nr:ABC transporter permease [Halobacteriovoraceae bacterium]|tara:strand:- start:16874 stop:17662 length:789 start_codon:yes stop_codon:yes gene_type:complete